MHAKISTNKRKPRTRKVEARNHRAIHAHIVCLSPIGEASERARAHLFLPFSLLNSFN
jgi:hypothetical protein